MRISNLRLLAIAIITGEIMALMASCSGCRAFYENSGADIDVGDTTVPLRLREPMSSLNLEFLFTLTGAKVWTAKDSDVKVSYRNTYTNNYLFGVVDKKGVQDFEVDVIPVSVNGIDESKQEKEDEPNSQQDMALPQNPAHAQKDS